MHAAQRLAEKVDLPLPDQLARCIVGGFDGGESIPPVVAAWPVGVRRKKEVQALAGGQVAR